MKKSLVMIVMAVVLPVGCTKSPGKLDRPWYLLNVEDGLCGSTVAVDGNGTIWREGGCESGGMSSMRAYGDATDEQLSRVRDAFEALAPSSSTDGGCADESLRRVNTLWNVADEHEDKWLFCVSGYSDPPPDWAWTSGRRGDDGRRHLLHSR